MSDNDSKPAHAKISARRRTFIESDSDSQQLEDPPSNSNWFTPKQQHSTTNKRSKGSRSSSRIQDKQKRVFKMPDKRSVFDKIETPEDNISLSLSEYKPRKLVNNFMKTTNRYNYDPAYTSGESSGIDDFLDDDFDYVDEDSFLSEDSNISSDPERSQIKTKERKRKTAKGKRKKSDEQGKPSPKFRQKQKQCKKLDQNSNKRTTRSSTSKDRHASKIKRIQYPNSKAAIHETDSDTTAYSEYSCPDDDEDVNTKKLHNRSYTKRTIQSDFDDDSDLPLSVLKDNWKEQQQTTSQPNDVFSHESDIPLSLLKQYSDSKSSTLHKDNSSSDNGVLPPKLRQKRTNSKSNLYGSEEDSNSESDTHSGIQSQENSSQESALVEQSLSSLQTLDKRSKYMAKRKSEHKHSFDFLRKKRLKRLSNEKSKNETKLTTSQNEVKTEIDSKSKQIRIRYSNSTVVIHETDSDVSVHSENSHKENEDTLNEEKVHNSSRISRAFESGSESDD